MSMVSLMGPQQQQAQEYQSSVGRLRVRADDLIQM